ncbi:MAG: UDP-N-acetylmuramate--L-alanine ligase [Patescibacteria group bacterium]
MHKKLSSLNKHIHFIGIGGIGISALARYFLSLGYKVSGSDSDYSELIDELKSDGIKVYIGHSPKNIAKSVQQVFYSNAIKQDISELIAARKLNIPTKSYAERLGDLTRQYKTLAVSGTCGKSTTTAMLSLVLIKAGFDPTVIIGTKLKEFNSPAGESNFRKGNSDYLIIEADEHNAAFLNHSPFAAIITNIERDHLDFYKNLKNIKNAFLKFINNIKSGGVLVINSDDENLKSLSDDIKKIAQKNKLKVFWCGNKNNKAIKNKIKKVLKVPGEHNISNALEVYTLAKTLNIKEKIILEALSEYNGAWRRMEYKGKFSIPNPPAGGQFSIPVYDDYAHHPSKIKAALAGYREKYPDSKIICVFQPHQADRLKKLFKDFTSSFGEANYLILLDIFKVKGRDRAFKNIINSENLAEAIKKRRQSPFVIYIKNPLGLKKIIKSLIQDSKSNIKDSVIIIMMGAGDIYKMTNNLLHRKE